MKQLEPSPKTDSINSINGRNGRSDAAERIGRSIAYMAEHLDQPIQVAALAARASISPSHFFALFKRETGSPPIDYFIRLRMGRARELLESTGVSVKEVAATLGYQDPFYFSRLFKSVNGVAPTDYRRLERENRDETRETALPVRNAYAAALQPCRLELARAVKHSRAAYA